MVATVGTQEFRKCTGEGVWYVATRVFRRPTTPQRSAWVRAAGGHKDMMPVGDHPWPAHGLVGFEFGGGKCVYLATLRLN